MQHGHGHAAGAKRCTVNMDMQHGHGHAAWTWTCSMDKNRNVDKHGQGLIMAGVTAENFILRSFSERVNERVSES